jgi:hypothetical protein
MQEDGTEKLTANKDTTTGTETRMTTISEDE